MAKQISAVGAAGAAIAQLFEEKITKPGDVNIDELTLLTSTGDIFDMKGFMIDLELHEDIWSPCLFGQITITDANNLINVAPWSNLPIIGTFSSLIINFIILPILVIIIT